MILLGPQVAGCFEDSSDVDTTDDNENETTVIHPESSAVASPSHQTRRDDIDIRSKSEIVQNETNHQIVSPLSSPSDVRLRVHGTPPGLRPSPFNAKQDSFLTLCNTTISTFGEETATNADNNNIVINNQDQSSQYWLLRVPKFVRLSQFVRESCQSRAAIFFGGYLLARPLFLFSMSVQVLTLIVITMSVLWLQQSQLSLSLHKKDNDNDYDSSRNETDEDESSAVASIEISATCPNNNRSYQHSNNNSHAGQPTAERIILPIILPATPIEGRSFHHDEDFMTPLMTTPISSSTVRHRHSGGMQQCFVTADSTCKATREAELLLKVQEQAQRQHDVNLALIQKYRQQTLSHLARVHAPFPTMESEDAICNRVTPTVLKFSTDFVKAQASFLAQVDSAIQIVQAATGMQCGVGPFSSAISRVERAVIARYSSSASSSSTANKDDQTTSASASATAMVSSSSSLPLQRIKVQLFQMMVTSLKNMEDLLHLLPSTATANANTATHMHGHGHGHQESSESALVLQHLSQLLKSVRRSLLAVEDQQSTTTSTTIITTTLTLSFLTDCRHQVASRLSRFVGRVFRTTVSSPSRSPSHPSNPAAAVALCRRLKDAITGTRDMALYLEHQAALPNHSSLMPSTSQRRHGGPHHAALLAKVDAACIAFWCANNNTNHHHPADESSSRDKTLDLDLDVVRKSLNHGDDFDVHHGDNRNIKSNSAAATERNTSSSSTTTSTSCDEATRHSHSSLWLKHGRDFLRESLTLCETLLNDAEDNTREGLDGTEDETNEGSTSTNTTSVDAEAKEYYKDKGGDQDETANQLRALHDADEALRRRQEQDPSLVLVYSGQSETVIPTKRRKKAVLASSLAPKEDPLVLLRELKHRLQYLDAPNEVNANVNNGEDHHHDNDMKHTTTNTACPTKVISKKDSSDNCIATIASVNDAAAAPLELLPISTTVPSNTTNRSDDTSEAEGEEQASTSTSVAVAPVMMSFGMIASDTGNATTNNFLSELAQAQNAFAFHNN
jgi:hypothetical protein